jgi:periplasmic divalent cation tolerance protein
MSPEPGREPESGVVGVYLTFPDAAAAEAVAEALVMRRLAACVNVFPAATSVYRWEDRLVREPEVVAWAKTTPDRLDALVATVEALHPYEVPCVVAYPAVGGAAAYLDWVRRETDPGGPA